MRLTSPRGRAGDRTMMLRRRELLFGAGAAALGACAPRLREPAAPAATAVPRGPAARWPPFAAGVTIDAAAAATFVAYDDPDPAQTARELPGLLAAARASGLSAVVTTVAPRGRFWLDDAAFDRTQRDIAAWKAQIAEHPDDLLLVERAADLETARRDRRLGVVFTFQGT